MNFRTFKFRESNTSSILPLKTIELSAGIGTALYLGNIASRIDGYVLGLANNREDPLYYEAYYQFARNSHRTMTINYNWLVATCM